MDRGSKGLVFILSAPAGTGKSTLSRMVCKQMSHVVESISFTTRAARQGEKEGVDYHFISLEEFKKKIASDDFLEYAEVFGNYYGTCKKQIEDLVAEGKHVILVIDVQGAMQIKKKIEATSIFIYPPSAEELKARLIKRGTESQESLKQRLSEAKKEMDIAPEYDYCIVNDDLLLAYSELKGIIESQESKLKKNKE